MAARYGAGQYEDAFSPHRLQNWSVPRTGRQASPWGTFVGTWDMPPRIPPARLDLTSRSATAAAQLMDRIRQPTSLTHACNGLRTEITGKPQEPWLDTQTAKEPSRRSSQASSEGIQPAGPPPGAPLEEPPGPGAGAAALLSHKPSCTEVRLKADTSPERPAARQPCSRQAKHEGQTPHSHQPAVPDLRRGDAGSPKIPALIHPALREASPRQATPPQVCAPSQGVSAEAEPRGGRSPRLRASPCAGWGEASPGGSTADARARQPSRTVL
ncbi:protein Flattop isoform X2 [Aquila chrysaetos chrysaetos]|uniref:protein Flattop isoform X2 n=1 Tax=Aquila chrysaetos chrysaetos TaxID=223781 RepID=UPI00117727CD|nr:protein Flattop isoform X2 [Aquila chrysaetos chrysaetos]